MNPIKVLEIKQSVFANNDAQADQLRQELKEKGIFLLNLMSSPGSGKTTTLRQTISRMKDDYRIGVQASRRHAYCGRIEGDYSNAAFLAAFNHIGSNIEITNLNPASLQGDRVYTAYFEQLSAGAPTLDVSDCPDLGPVLFALAALKNGATFTGTDRLKAKESDRGAAMHAELQKLGGGLVFGDNTIFVPKQELQYRGTLLDGHNDHRIVMALSVILSKIGGKIDGVEAVRKSYPGFFDDIQRLGAKVELL